MFLGIFFSLFAYYCGLLITFANTLDPDQNVGHDLSSADFFQNQLFYAPNFEKVEGAFCFGLVRPCVHPSVTSLREGFEIS